MQAAPLILMAAATAVSTYAAVESGRQQKRAANYNASMAKYQAEVAKKAAEDRAATYRREAARRMASMRAAYGAAGVTMEGTPLITLMESAKEAKKDELRILRGGELESWGLLSEAEEQKAAGRSGESQSYLTAGSTLLGGASRMGADYSKMKLRTGSGEG